MFNRVLLPKEKLSPVVITGSCVGSLGIVQSLKNLGIEILAIDSDLTSPSAHTRFSKKIRCENMIDDDVLLNVLIDTAKKCNRKPILFLTNDKYVLSISSNRKLLQDYYYFTFPDELVVKTLLVKDRFAEYAIKEKLQIPLTITINSSEDIKKAAENQRYPCVMKPSIKTKFWEEKHGINKVYRISSRKEFIKKAEEHFSVMNIPLIAQDWIEGPESNIHFCLVYYNQHSLCKEYFTGRKLLQWPFETGNTCIAESTQNDYIARESINFFNKINFKGLGSLEFKYDASSNKYFIIEATVGRTDFQSSITLGKEINMPLSYYCDLSGIKLPTITSKKKRKVFWIAEESCFSLLRRGRLFKELPINVWKDILINKKIFTLLYPDDPAPFLYLLRSFMVRIFRFALLLDRNSIKKV